MVQFILKDIVLATVIQKQSVYRAVVDVVVPDGGGATQASADFTDTADVAEPFASFIGGEGKTWTINRSATGVKLAVVDRDLCLLGTGDYFQVPHHAGLNFADGVDWSILLAFRGYGTPVGGDTLIAKRDVAPVGYTFPDNGTPLYYADLHDGVNQIFSAAPNRSYIAGELFVLAYTFEEGVALEQYWDGVNTSTQTVIAALGDMSNTVDLFIGSSAASGGYSDIEFMGAAIFREALDLADIVQAGNELLGIIGPRLIARGIAWRRA